MVREVRYAVRRQAEAAARPTRSAVVLAVIAILIAWESIGRLRHPVTISFDEAILVAGIGLAVNLLSAYMLRNRHSDHAHQGGHHHDQNLRVAYLHVLADAMTSVLAILALLTGKYFGWIWMDAAMGLVGSVIIGRWSYGFLRDTSHVLLDGDVDSELQEQVRRAVEEHADSRVTDLHLWRIGPRQLSAIVCVTTHNPESPEHYKQLISSRVDVTHPMVEVNRCPGDTYAPPR